MTLPIAPAVILITDPRWSDDELCRTADMVFRATEPGAIALQLRDKVREGRAILSLAERLRAISSDRGAPFYVNDRLDIALAVAADGVHLGEASVPVADARRLLGETAFVSVAAHNLEDVDRARAAAATALLVSPIFATPGKGAPRGTPFVSEAQQWARGMPVYALGGVDASNAAACRQAGADGVAVVRAVWEAADPGAIAVRLVAAIRSDRG